MSYRRKKEVPPFEMPSVIAIFDTLLKTHQHEQSVHLIDSLSPQNAYVIKQISTASSLNPFTIMHASCHVDWHCIQQGCWCELFRDAFPGGHTTIGLSNQSIGKSACDFMVNQCLVTTYQNGKSALCSLRLPKSDICLMGKKIYSQWKQKDDQKPDKLAGNKRKLNDDEIDEETVTEWNDNFYSKEQDHVHQQMAVQDRRIKNAFDQTACYIKVYELVKDPASGGFKGRASNIRKTYELCDIHGGQMYTMEHEYSGLNERLGKQECKSLILTYGEASLPQLSYSGSNYSLSGSEKMWSTQSIFGTWRDCPEVMEGIYDGRLSRMTLYTPQSTWIPPVNKLNAILNAENGDLMNGLSLYTNMTTTELMISSIQMKRDECVNEHLWVQRDEPINLDKYIRGFQLAESELSSSILPPGYDGRKREFMWCFNDLLVTTDMNIQETNDDENSYNNKNENDNKHKNTNIVTYTPSRHVMSTNTLLTPITKKSNSKISNIGHLDSIDEQSQTLSNELEMKNDQPTENENEEPLIELVSNVNNLSPIDNVSLSYYRDLSEFMAENDQQFVEKGAQKTYIFGRENTREIKCSPVCMREKRLTCTFAPSGLFGDVEDIDFDEENLESLISIRPNWQRIIDADENTVGVVVPEDELSPIAINCAGKYLEEGKMSLFVPHFFPVNAMKQAIADNPQLFKRVLRKIADMALIFTIRSTLIDLGASVFSDILVTNHMRVLLMGNDFYFRKEAYVDAAVVQIYDLLFQNKLFRMVQTIMRKCPKVLQRIDYETLCNSICSTGGNILPSPLDITTIETTTNNKGQLIDSQTGCLLKDGREHAAVSDRCLSIASLLCKDWYRNGDEYKDIKDVYSDIKKWFKNESNTQAGAALWEFGFKVLAHSGLVNGVCKRYNRAWCVMFPHEIPAELLPKAKKLFDELFACPWTQGRSLNLEPDTYWWYLNVLEFDYKLESIDINLSTLPNEKMIDFFEGRLSWQLLYDSLGINTVELIAQISLHPVRQMISAEQAMEKAKINKKKNQEVKNLKNLN